MKLSYTQAKQLFGEHIADAEARGVHFEGATSYLPTGWAQNFKLASDAMPALTTTANNGVPFWLTTFVDPETFRIAFSPNKAAEILGEERKGDWTTTTAQFRVVENGGEVSSYGDFSNDGNTTSNANFPMRQSYLYQTVISVGDREIEMAGTAKIDLIREKNESAALVMNKFTNLSYFFGVGGVQQYGLLNDPDLPTALTPATKDYGAATWFGTAGNATANEVYNDIVDIFHDIVTRSGGLVEATDPMVLTLSPESAVALTFTNTYNVNVTDMLKKNYPNMRIVTAVQMGEKTSTNPQGISGGNEVMLIAEKVGGERTGYCAYNEKMRTFPMVREMSAFKQKAVCGTFGSVLRTTAGIGVMLGV